MARSSRLPHRKVVQATALLELAGGRSVRSTAKLLRTYPNTVAAWRDRFIEAGVAGVGVIAPGRGRKPEIEPATVEAIVHDMLHAVHDDGSTCWSTRTLGARHGVGKDTVSARTRCSGSGRRGICGLGRSTRSSCRTTLTSKRSSSMLSGCISTRRSGRWCSPSMRRPSARRSTGHSRHCRSSPVGDGR